MKRTSSLGRTVPGSTSAVTMIAKFTFPVRKLALARLLLPDLELAEVLGPAVTGDRPDA